MLRLVVRLDPIARLRPSPAAKVPDLHAAAHAAVLGGASAVRLTLGAEAEARDLAERLEAGLQLDVAPEAEAVATALRVKPERVCLVAADLAAAPSGLVDAIERLAQAGIPSALRLPPTEQALLKANEAGAVWADLDTSRFAAATHEGVRLKEFLALSRAVDTAHQLGMRVTVGGGLGVGTLARVATLSDIEEAHVGFGALSRALFTGLTQAVRDLRADAGVGSSAVGDVATAEGD